MCVSVVISPPDMHLLSKYIQHHHLKQSPIKGILCKGLLLFVAILISWTQLAAFSSTAAIDNKKASLKTNLHLTAQLPAESYPLHADMELTAEDDEDKKVTADEFRNPYAYNHIKRELNYTTYLKNRFSQLELSVAHQPVIAYFLLYHSWKSHLI